MPVMENKESNLERIILKEDRLEIVTSGGRHELFELKHLEKSVSLSMNRDGNFCSVIRKVFTRPKAYDIFRIPKYLVEITIDGNTKKQTIEIIRV